MIKFTFVKQKVIKDNNKKVIKTEPKFTFIRKVIQKKSEKKLYCVTQSYRNSEKALLKKRSRYPREVDSLNFFYNTKGNFHIKFSISLYFLVANMTPKQKFLSVKISEKRDKK